jgi:hypothetical protein
MNINNMNNKILIILKNKENHLYLTKINKNKIRMFKIISRIINHIFKMNITCNKINNNNSSNKRLIRILK